MRSSFYRAYITPLLWAAALGGLAGCQTTPEAGGDALGGTPLGGTAAVGTPSGGTPSTVPALEHEPLDTMAANAVEPALDTHYSTNERELHTLFARARGWVEQGTGTQLDHVGLIVTSAEIIDREVGRETLSLVNRQFDDQQFIEHFHNNVMFGQRGSYVALYAPRNRSVMLNRLLIEDYLNATGRHASVEALQSIHEQALLALLIHELVHAADDKQHQIHDHVTPSFRASFAHAAVYEGHAQWLTRQLCAQHDCTAGLAALEQYMFNGGTHTAGTLATSAISRSSGLLEYAYREGERFIAALAARPAGQRSIFAALDTPPDDPIQILDPDSFPNAQRRAVNDDLLATAASVKPPFQAGDWRAVETSPLSGITLSPDPEQRAAVVDGFTRLITGMVAMQLYDQSRPLQAPVETTLIRTSTDATAALFASTLHDNAMVQGIDERLSRHHLPGAGMDHDVVVYVAEQISAMSDAAVVTAAAGSHVIQLFGAVEQEDAMIAYAMDFLAISEGLPMPSGQKLSTTDRSTRSGF